jgi:hypothetical protein
MDIQETAKLLNIVVNGCPVELVQYIDGLLNESNKIGVEFGRVSVKADDQQLMGGKCERCGARDTDSVLHFDGSRWAVCGVCRKDALMFFNQYMYPARTSAAKQEAYNTAFDRGFEHGITVTKQQHGIKD